MFNHEPTAHDALNEVMEFEHVIRVHADGSVTDEPDVYAPDLAVSYDDKGEHITLSDGWTLLSGYSGQFQYSGPIMHPSEFIGGHMADSILSTPGVYVALVATSLDDAPDGDDSSAGWAVARRND